MRYELLTNIGGFLWWILIKFCKTNLKSEQTKDKWSRNLFFLIFNNNLSISINGLSTESAINTPDIAFITNIFLSFFFKIVYHFQGTLKNLDLV